MDGSCSTALPACVAEACWSHGAPPEGACTVTSFPVAGHGASCCAGPVAAGLLLGTVADSGPRKWLSGRQKSVFMILWYSMLRSSYVTNTSLFQPAEFANTNVHRCPPFPSSFGFNMRGMYVQRAVTTKLTKHVSCLFHPVSRKHLRLHCKGVFEYVLVFNFLQRLHFGASSTATFTLAGSTSSNTRAAGSVYWGTCWNA